MQTPEMFADELLQKFCKTEDILKITLPIDSFAVASYLSVIVNPFPEAEKSLSGELFPSKKCLFFNAADSLHRQKFAIAQELGHLVLGHPYHHKLQRETPLYAIYDMDEKKAIKFAYELLIPKLVVKHVLQKRKIQASEKLAEIFDVHVQTMEARLKDLGLTVGTMPRKRTKKIQALFDYLGNEAVMSAS